MTASPAPAAGDPRLALLLALADDELIIGHRHSHWTGVAPHLEEDLAFSSIAQDEIGHAVVWYELAADLADAATVAALAPHAPAGGDPLDALGLGRAPHGYRHALLCERAPGDWAYTLARQHVYDTVDAARLEVLAGSSWTAVADATGALRREERYHLEHARAWLVRLAAHDDARARLEAALAAVLAEAGGLVEELPGEAELVEAGVLPGGHAAIGARARDLLAADLDPLGLGAPLLATPWGGLGGRLGQRSEDFAALWDELTGTYRAHPGARW